MKSLACAACSARSNRPLSTAARPCRVRGLSGSSCAASRKFTSAPLPSSPSRPPRRSSSPARLNASTRCAVSTSRCSARTFGSCGARASATKATSRACSNASSWRSVCSISAAPRSSNRPRACSRPRRLAASLPPARCWIARYKGIASPASRYRRSSRNAWSARLRTCAGGSSPNSTAGGCHCATVSADSSPPMDTFGLLGTVAGAGCGATAGAGVGAREQAHTLRAAKRAAKKT